MTDPVELATFRYQSPAALPAAYVAFLLHVGIDWDWEMPIVMLAGLACGAALLLGIRVRSSRCPDGIRLQQWRGCRLGR